MFIDRVTLKLTAGKGGNGMNSFRREKYVPLGGPNGGDGGKGGDIVFEGDSNKSTLLDLRYQKHLKAKAGESGKSKKMHGASGNDVIVKVPLGTLVIDQVTQQTIADLTYHGQQIIVAHGGRGGRGNFRFMSSRQPAPDFAELGEPGEIKEVIVELKLLADVGLIGFPSVGKSTFLAVVSQAKPEIAEYPFTTLVPNLGVASTLDQRSFVIADLPGLIAGASLGKGLGQDFLRHIERCRVLIHIIDMGGEDGHDPLADYVVINAELAAYKPELATRPQIIVANKMDLPKAAENLQRFKAAYPALMVYETITLINTGLAPVLLKAADLLAETPLYPSANLSDQGVIYKYVAPAAPFEVINRGNGRYELVGPEVERLFKMTDIQNETALLRFAHTLRRMGVADALMEKGADYGDTIIILNYEFEFVA